MSIQLSLYWQSAEQLEWIWSSDSSKQQGSLSDLMDAKQKRNLPSCQVRLFLPYRWFSTIELTLPTRSKNVSAQILKYAAEEYLAQDIETVHLVPGLPQSNGKTSVLVTDLARLTQLLTTLEQSGLTVVEAFSNQHFLLPDDPGTPVVIQVLDDAVLLQFESRIIRVHPKGFSQWFALWSEQNGLLENENIHLFSPTEGGHAKTLHTEIEASIGTVSWVVQPVLSLEDWHKRSEKRHNSNNLIVGNFRKKDSSILWKGSLPFVTASVIAFALWVIVSTVQNLRLEQEIEMTWQASEKIFLQVFGQDKRIQRPLMLREMRSLATVSDNESRDDSNSLTLLNDLLLAAPTLYLEDFRFNKSRNESTITVIQSTEVESDAFGHFELLKSNLTERGYSVEYSANQDSQHYRAQFKVVFGAGS